VFPDVLSFVPGESIATEPSRLPEPVGEPPLHASLESAAENFRANTADDILSKLQPADLIRAFFTLLLAHSQETKDAWRTFHVLLRENCDAFSKALGENEAEEDLIDLLGLFLIPVARNAVFSPDRTVQMFHTAERYGIHILPVHFYSPVPNTSAVDESVWND